MNSIPGDNDVTMQEEEDTGRELPRSNPHAVRPSTFRQLLRAEQSHSDANFTIDGQEVAILRVVAHLRAVKEHPMYYDYLLDDGTGEITARQWRSEGESGCIQEDDEHIGYGYVRVSGKLNRRPGTRTSTNQLQVINIHKIPRCDTEEINFHYLLAAVTSLYFLYGPPPQSVLQQLKGPQITTRKTPTSPSVAQAASIGTAVPTSHVNPTSPAVSIGPPVVPSPSQPFKFKPAVPSAALARPAVPPVSPSPSRSSHPSKFQPAAISSPASGSRTAVEQNVSDQPAKVVDKRGSRRLSGRDPLSHLSSLKRGIILAILNATPSDHGIDVKVIIAAIKHMSLTQKDIETALDELLDEDYIVIGLNAWHYKVTPRCTDREKKYAALHVENS